MLAAAGEAADRWFVANREHLDPQDADRLALTLFSALQRLGEPPAGGAPSPHEKGRRT